MRTSNQYINCDFIVGSTAKIERIWSHVKYILSENRSRMSLLLFESIMFLKFNKRFWDQSTVAAALKNARDSQRVARKTEQ